MRCDLKKRLLQKKSMTTVAKPLKAEIHLAKNQAWGPKKNTLKLNKKNHRALGMDKAVLKIKEMMIPNSWRSWAGLLATKLRKA